MSEVRIRDEDIPEHGRSLSRVQDQELRSLKTRGGEGLCVEGQREASQVP